jgi:hypothetical protein
MIFPFLLVFPLSFSVRRLFPLMSYPVYVRLNRHAYVRVGVAVRALFGFHGVRFGRLVARFAAAQCDVSGVTFAAHMAFNLDHFPPPSLVKSLLHKKLHAQYG